jgi:hypothetical protein
MRRAIVAVMMTAWTAAAPARAAENDMDPSARSERGDYLFPRAGGFSASLGTGLPFLSIGEVAYGVGPGFSAGAVVAATPDAAGLKGTAAVGVRPRGVLFRAGRWRSALVASALYYPSVPGFGGPRDPWVLVRPELTLERRMDSGAWVNVGVGVVGAACLESLLTLGKEHDPTVMGGVWDTARIGGAVPLSGGASLFGEASLVMSGVVPARQWIGVVPVVAVIGVEVGL